MYANIYPNTNLFTNKEKHNAMECSCCKNCLNTKQLIWNIDLSDLNHQYYYNIEYYNILEII